MKRRKIWTIVGIVILAAAVIVFMLCWNRSKAPHQVSKLPLMSKATATDISKGRPKETSKAEFTYNQAKKTLTLTSTNHPAGTTGVFSYPEYLFTDPNALSQDPALFFMWNNNIGSIDDDMKNALYFAFNPAICSGKITRFLDAGKNQKLHWNKSYVFYTVNNKLTNYDYTDGTARYNVTYLYTQDGRLRKITYSNSSGFSMDITILYQGDTSCGFKIYDTGSKRTTTEKWKCHFNKKGQAVSLKTDARTYAFQYEKAGGYLTRISLDNRYQISYTYGKGHSLSQLQSVVNIDKKRASTLTYKFQYNRQKL